MMLARRLPAAPAMKILMAPAATLLALGVATAAPAADPFAFFRPGVDVTANDRRQLAADEPVTRVLPGKDHQVAVFAAVPVNIDGDRLVAWTRRITELKKSAYVTAIGRFSDPPRVEDLRALALDDADLSAIRGCHPGDCALKLSAAEMETLRHAAAVGAEDWKAAAQQAFREVVLQRVRQYLDDGQVPAYEDKSRPVEPSSRFTALLAETTFLTTQVPEFVHHLSSEPAGAPQIESFFYWSKERLSGKAIVSVTRVSIFRGADADSPAVLVAGRQIYATHYFDASLGLTALLHGEPGGRNYLAYVNRSDVDVLGGFFGGLVRAVMQRRMKGEAADVLRDLRRRLESGAPPGP